MTTRFGLLLAITALAGLIACSDDDKGDPTSQCTDHTQCAPGKECSDAGTCEDLAPGACRKVEDCPAGNTCENDLCVAPPECTAHAECPAHEECAPGGTCEALQPGACRKPTDCAASENCVDDVCVPAVQCTTDDQCQPKYYCSSGTCAPLAAGACHRPVDCDAGQTCEAGSCVSSAECDKPANVTEAARLRALQPTFGVRSKVVRTFDTSFASVGGNPNVQCPLTGLQFKDLNDSNSLQPYEDWTKSAEARAADLAGRMTKAEKLALMAHGIFSDTPTTANPHPSAGSLALVTAGLRFGLTTANVPADAGLSFPKNRAIWANDIQAAAEASTLGIPFVISSEPSHSAVGGRVVGSGFSAWPSEAGLGAANDLALTEKYGNYVAQEYRAVGITMAISPSANLATEPRWDGVQFSFGENSADVSAQVGAFVKGLQKPVDAPAAATGAASKKRPGVAAVIGHFPGAGPATDGHDQRTASGKNYTYPGDNFDAHANAFQGAFTNAVAGVMTGYGIPSRGPWTGLGGVLNGSTIEEVGSSFNSAIVSGALRGHFHFGGLVVAPAGVLENESVAPLGAPWGVESLTKAQRIAKAAGAGVDQFMGLNDTIALTAANLDDATVDGAAARALAVAYRLGLFEDPYVYETRADEFCNSPAATSTAETVQGKSLVLLLNVEKPIGWLDGGGDRTDTGNPGNAGNGTGLVLPAPPGKPYIAPGCDYYVAGDINLEYVQGVSSGYGFMTNRQSTVTKKFDPNTEDDDVTVPTPTAADQMAMADYVFIRIAAPSGSLEYSSDDELLAPVRAARAAIDAWNAAGTARPVPSQTQIVVAVDAGRPAVLNSLLSGTYGISGLYVTWIGKYATAADPPVILNEIADKTFLDVAIGIVNGSGKLPMALQASQSAADAQLEDVPGDGADATFVRGFGLMTTMF